MFLAEVISKRLELLREILPQPGLIAYLVPGRTTPAAPVELREVEAAAQAVGQQQRSAVMRLLPHLKGNCNKFFEKYSLCLSSNLTFRPNPIPAR